METATIEPTNSFSRQLGFWGLHCGLTAIPSFCIALTKLNDADEVLGMLCGILTFVFGYTFLTSAGFYGKIHRGLIGKSIKWGARIRMFISVFSIPLLLTTLGKGKPSEEVMFVPDMWFGLAALILFSIGARVIGFDLGNTGAGDLGFFATYTVTMIEGVLISISLILIAFISLVVLNYKRNRNRLPSEFIPS